ncbi:MAG: hypothetical protein GTN69_06910 [Armatimonadetes bacterium]|nr:hypothetical protein [Armatimonadota bacterium]
MTIAPTIASSATATGTSSVVLAENMDRAGLTIDNYGSVPVWLNFGAAAVVGSGLMVKAGGSRSFASTFKDNQFAKLDVYAITEGVSADLGILEVVGRGGPPITGTEGNGLLESTISQPEGAQSVIVANPSHLYGDDVVLIQQDNVPVGAPEISEEFDFSKFRAPKYIQVIHTGAGLTSKIFFSAEPGDITTITYAAVSGLEPISGSGGYWLVEFPCRAARITVDSTVATDDVKICGSLR